METPVYKRRWRDSYRAVNQRFAEAAADCAVATLRGHRPGPPVSTVLDGQHLVEA